MEQWLRKHIHQNFNNELIRLVYFMEAKGSRVDGLVKIGHSNNVRLRKHQIETWHHCDMIHIRVLPVAIPENKSYSYQLEQHIHRRFGEYRQIIGPRYSKSTEWFCPGPELVSFMQDNTIQYVKGIHGSTIAEALTLAATNTPYTPRLAATEQGEAT